MNRFVTITLAFCITFIAPMTRADNGSTPARATLDTLRTGHPRLLLSSSECEQLKARLSKDEVLREWNDIIRRRADGLLDDVPSHYHIPDGKRLLSTCRRVLDRTYTLALMYRLHKDKRHKDRLWLELKTTAAFKDWNPSHFLDTAEMTHAFAIGYDWLYHDWSESQRRTIREAIVRHGLTPGVNSYRGKARYGWFARSKHNWNQVCNGGMTIGALAIADEKSKLAEEIISAAIKSVPLAMKSYAPDGAWGEGVGYWHYATSYNVVMLAALDSALGSDFELSKAKGFDQCGLFPIHMLGTAGMSFNFADTGKHRATQAPELFWLARRFDQPAYAAYQRQHAAPHPLDMVWYPTKGIAKARPALPPDKYFRAAETVSMRSSWDDQNAVYVAFKAGDNKVNHSHLDPGSFVLDALGERWAVDLGSDDYNLPSYFGRKRWDYYRLRAEGHNTLVLNPGIKADQNPRAATRITKFNSTPQHAFGIADLTPVYAASAQRVQRGIALLDRQTVLIQDELKCEQPAELWWFMHTPARVSIGDDGRAAKLNRNGKHLNVRILEPAGARFDIRPAEPLATSPNPKGQRANTDVKKLAIHFTKIRNLRVVVAFEPVTNNDAPAITIKPLAEW